jgi:hypothetical protein
VLLLFTGCEAVVRNAGIMAVTVGGVAVGWLDQDGGRGLREFKDQITALLIGALFILLTADIRIADVTALSQSGLAVVLALVLIVRPVSAWLSTAGSQLSGRERAFIAWVAPRGIVAAAITSLTADALEHAGLTGGTELRGLVFLTITVTVVLAGLTARPVASLLKLRLPGRNRVAILHADGLGILLANELKQAGTPVVFLDADPKRCQVVQDLGHTVVYGDALEERTLARAQFELVGTAIGLSGNEHLNSLFVTQAHESFGVPRSLVALAALPADGLPRRLRRAHVGVLFEGPHDLGRWDVRHRHRQVEVVSLLYSPAPPADKIPAEEQAPPATARTGEIPATQERYVMLAVRRGGRLQPMWHGCEFKRGDVMVAAIYQPEREVVLQELGARGWTLAAQPVTAAAGAESPGA